MLGLPFRYRGSREEAQSSGSRFCSPSWAASLLGDIDTHGDHLVACPPHGSLPTWAPAIFHSTSTLPMVTCRTLEFLWSLKWPTSPFSDQTSHLVSSVTPLLPPKQGHSLSSLSLSCHPASMLRATESQNVFQTQKEYCGLIISEHFSQTFLGPKMCNSATLNKCPALRRFLVCLLSLFGVFFPSLVHRNFFFVEHKVCIVVCVRVCFSCPPDKAVC